MKKIIFLIIVIFLLIAIGNFVNSIYHLWHKKDLLTQMQKQLDNEESENKKLNAELSKVNSPMFIEEEARNKLFMVRPGEKNVIIPQSQEDGKQKKSSVKKEKPSWVRWKDFFYF